MISDAAGAARASQGRGTTQMARVQRVQFPDRPHTFIVVGADLLPVAPAREYLRYLTDSGSSPNTVRGYAYGLAAWWTVLEHTGQRWDDFPTSLFGQFLAYLRSGDLPGTARIGEPQAAMAASSLQPRGAAVLSMYRYFAQAHDLDRPYRRLFTSAAGRSRGRYKDFLTGVGPRRERDAPIYRRRTPNKAETPVLLPAQVNTILDSCSRQRADGSWTGGPAGLRDRFCFSRCWPRPGCGWAKPYRCATTISISLVG